MLPELEQESVHHDIQINRNIFFRLIIINFVGIERILILEMKLTSEISLRVKGVCRIGIREILVIGMFGQVEFVGKEGANTTDLQNTLAAVHRRQLVLRHEFFATMSSDELKKMAATIKEFLFVATILIIISLTCTA